MIRSPLGSSPGISNLILLVVVVVGQVATSADRTATLEGVNDLPPGGLGRRLVSGDRDLARSTTVNSGSTQIPRELLSRTHCPVVCGGGSVGYTLAGKVGTVACERGLARVSEWDRVGHDGVGVCGDGRQSQHGSQSGGCEVNHSA
jgi:hypothetical protein